MDSLPESRANRCLRATYRHGANPGSYYYHVVAAAFLEREVDVRLFYTHQGEAVPVEPLST